MKEGERKERRTGEKVGGEAHGAVDEARVKIDVGVPNEKVERSQNQVLFENGTRSETHSLRCLK